MVTSMETPWVGFVQTQESARDEYLDEVEALLQRAKAIGKNACAL
jgi:hypothetical protein